MVLAFEPTWLPAPLTGNSLPIVSLPLAFTKAKVRFAASAGAFTGDWADAAVAETASTPTATASARRARAGICVHEVMPVHTPKRPGQFPRA